MPLKPISFIVLTCVVAVPVLVLALQGARSRRNPPASLGSAGTGLSACPSALNCVSSSGGGGQGTVAPLQSRGSAEETRRHLLEVLQGFPRTRVTSDAWPYLRVEFQSRCFGFVDDVEFLADETTGRIDFRSASRVGSYDAGVNRRRITEIRRRFDAVQGSAGLKADP